MKLRMEFNLFFVSILKSFTLNTLIPRELRNLSFNLSLSSSCKSESNSIHKDLEGIK